MTHRRVRTAALLLGVGLGGFVDGIVLHQVVQWHQMLVLWSAAQRRVPLPSTRAFFGDMLVGWGGFNLVEGIIDHHLLQLHHVRDLPEHLPAYALRDGKRRASGGEVAEGR